jgi:hypothetical protein
VSNLHRYVEVHGTSFFGPGGEVHEWNPDEWDPFYLAAENGSIDALHVLVKIYQSDPSKRSHLKLDLDARTSNY